MSISPIAIGGVGGSGTRVVAELLRSAGAYMGSDVNAEGDTLTFTLLFKFRECFNLPDDAFFDRYQVFRDYLTGADAHSTLLNDRTRRELIGGNRAGQHTSEWLEERFDHLISHPRQPSPPSLWGWKAPNTHILLDKFVRAEPDLRYIHVLRHGLDMAISRNQNQALLWGGLLPGTTPDHSPYASLRFWCASNSRTLEIAEALGKRSLVVNYDQLCISPRDHIERILHFAGISFSPEFLDSRVDCIDQPPSKRRSRHIPLEEFNPRDIEYVHSLGFEI